jgi:hypothetical protein
MLVLSIEILVLRFSSLMQTDEVIRDYPASLIIPLFLGSTNVNHSRFTFLKIAIA